MNRRSFLTFLLSGVAALHSKVWPITTIGTFNVPTIVDYKELSDTTRKAFMPRLYVQLYDGDFMKFADDAARDAPDLRDPGATSPA